MASAPTCRKCGTSHWSTQPCGKGSGKEAATRVAPGSVAETLKRDAVVESLQDRVSALEKRLLSLERWRETSTAERAGQRRAGNTLSGGAVEGPVSDNTVTPDNTKSRAARNQAAYRARKKARDSGA